MSVSAGARETARVPWRYVAWGLFGAILVLTLAGFVFEELAAQHAVGGESLTQEIPLLIAFLAFPAVGALIVSREPRNAFGWVLLMIGGLVALLVPTESWARESFVERSEPLPLGTFAAWIQSWAWMPMIGTIPTILLQLFPDGRVVSKAWRPLLWASVGLVSMVTVMAMLQRDIGNGYELRNPIGIMPFDKAEEAVPFWVLFPLIALSIASLIVRYHRSRGLERQQVKWVAFACSLFAALLIAGDTFDLPEILFPVAIMLIPGSIAVAVFRYRLYEIDVIINKSIVYVVLTALLSAVYVAIVAALQAVISPAAGGSQLTIAASTLTVAALFRPVRRRVQELIDHLFYRRKYDAAKTLEDFTSRLREEIDLDTLTQELVAVVNETMQPKHVSLWLRPARPAPAPGSTQWGR